MTPASRPAPDGPHRRLNRLTGEWVLVSPQRADRPWRGQVEPSPPAVRPPAHDPGCHLCPGNRRAGGAHNPDYPGVHVFDNDFPALLPTTGASTVGGGLLVAEPERGVCRVICYSPHHGRGLGELEPAEIRAVIDAWAGQYADLGAVDWVRHVLAFENRGAMMGASSPHPHGQIWANASLPAEPARELRTQREYAATHDSCLLCDYLATELADGARIVDADRHFVVLVPFWAVWPFETMILPRAHLGALPELSGTERDALAALLRRFTRRTDALFGAPFPGSTGWHQRPTDGAAHPQWHLHGHSYPPLLRSATVRKFLVGYELLAEPQRDITPEAAAARLREAS